MLKAIIQFLNLAPYENLIIFAGDKITTQHKNIIKKEIGNIVKEY